jgi:Putative zinc-finger
VTASCARWHGAIAMDALGALPEAERAGLLAHLDGCPACREEARELAATASVLRLVDPAALDHTASVSPELTSRVLGQLHHGGQRVRRRRRVAAVLVGAAVAASIAIVVAFTASSPVARPPERIALIGPNSVTATATLAARTWGTSVTLTEDGQQAAGNYTVSMRTASGSWWATGSYHEVAGKPVDAMMTCAVPLSQITGVRVTNAAGATVLWSESASVPRW